MHMRAAPQSTTGTWGGNPQALQDPSAYAATPTTSNSMPTTATIIPDEQSAPISGEATTSTIIATSPQANSSPFTSPTTGLPKSTAASVSSDSGNADDAFAQAFVSSDLSLTSAGVDATPVSAVPTPEQQALHDYGNRAGAAIVHFESTHADQVSTLNALTSDRGSEQKAAAFRAIAHDLGAIGTALLALSAVPASAQAQNAALAHSYITAGELLAAIPDAGTDDAKFVEAIKSYDAAVETLNRNYINLVNLFALSSVTFGPGEAGNAFVFSGF
jgi:hypothetical protein